MLTISKALIISHLKDFSCFEMSQKTAKEPLLHLEVEGLEINARMRNAAAKTPTHSTEAKPEVSGGVGKVLNSEELDLSTRGFEILTQVRLLKVRMASYVQTAYYTTR